MVEVIIMFCLSDIMEEGIVVNWFKKVGDKVNEGDILVEIEIDKVIMEFEFFYEGILLYIGINEGEIVKVDVFLVIIGKEGEDILDLLNGEKIEILDKKEEKEIFKSEDVF